MQSFDDFLASAREVFGPAVVAQAADTGPVGAGTAASGAVGAPCLEYSTLNPSVVCVASGHTSETGFWNATVEWYPDGSPRVVLCSSRPAFRRKDGRERLLKGQSGRFSSAIVRARAQLRRRLRCIRADHLYTFTKRGKFESLDAAWLAWKEFLRLMGLRFPGRAWVYVAVPEQHADGTWHIHAGVPGFWDIAAVRVVWIRALGGARAATHGPDCPGNVDVKYKGWNGRLGARRLSRYIAKYVGKGFGAVDAGRKLFSSSKGCLSALELERFHFPWVAGVEELESVVSAHLQGSRGRVFEFDRRLFQGDGYWCWVFEEPG